MDTVVGNPIIIDGIPLPSDTPLFLMFVALHLAAGLTSVVAGVLIIVTTIELDPKHHRYDDRLIERLSRAARGYLALSSKATAFVLQSAEGRPARRESAL
jgi:hypothetical protein